MMFFSKNIIWGLPPGKLIALLGGLSFLLPAALYGQYAGGTGRGDTLAAKENIQLTGPVYSPAYSGGTGRGDTLALLENFFLNGPCANPPAVSCPADIFVCNTDDPITLSGGTPGGGTYTGSKVVNGVFSPAAAGSGQFTITYTITDTAGCSNSCVFYITVIGTPSANTPTDSAGCNQLVLPALVGGGNYFTEPNRAGTQLMTGDTVLATQKLYVFAESATTPNCVSQDSFEAVVYGAFASGSIQTTGEVICAQSAPALIGNAQSPSGGDGTYRYQWWKSTDQFVSDSTELTGDTLQTLQPPSTLTADTWYKRKASDEFCQQSLISSSGVWKVAMENTPPSASCRPVTVQLGQSGTATVNSASVNNQSSDNCSIQSMTLSKTSFDCADIGTNQVTLTVTDGAGNAATCNATVTVQDNLPPAGTCQDTASVILLWEGGSLIAASLAGGLTDNCDGSNFELSFSSNFNLNTLHFNCESAVQGAQSVILYIRDSEGNQRSCSMTRAFNHGGDCNCMGQQVNLTGNITQNNYAGELSINASGTIETGDSVGFKAGETIALAPGFHAKTGSSFRAKIEGCIPGSGQPPVQAENENEFLQVETDGVTGASNRAQPSSGNEEGLTFQVFPNPFQRTVHLSFFLPEPGPVSLELQAASGLPLPFLLKEKWMEAGTHELTMDGAGLPAGIYIIYLKTEKEIQVSRILKVNP